jgi:hypothetical protein
MIVPTSLFLRAFFVHPFTTQAGHLAEKPRGRTAASARESSISGHHRSSATVDQGVRRSSARGVLTESLPLEESGARHGREPEGAGGCFLNRVRKFHRPTPSRRAFGAALFQEGTDSRGGEYEHGLSPRRVRDGVASG